jgi:hypothetical protein
VSCSFLEGFGVRLGSQGIISPTIPQSLLPDDSPFRAGSITKPSQSTLPPFGSNKGFVIVEGLALKPYLDKLEPKEGIKREEADATTTAPAAAAAAGDGVAPSEDAPAPMEVD